MTIMVELTGIGKELPKHAKIYYSKTIEIAQKTIDKFITENRPMPEKVYYYKEYLYIPTNETHGY